MPALLLFLDGLTPESRMMGGGSKGEMQEKRKDVLCLERTA